MLRRIYALKIETARGAMQRSPEESGDYQPGECGDYQPGECGAQCHFGQAPGRWTLHH